MNPTSAVPPLPLLPRDLNEEMLEELAIIAMEAREEDDDVPMPQKEAFQVAAFVQACILERSGERPAANS